MSKLWIVGLLLVGCSDGDDDQPAGDDAGLPSEDGSIDIPDGDVPADGIHFAFDYRYDDAGFFTPAHQAVLQAAADHWSKLIVDDFPSIPAGTEARTRDPEVPTAAAISVSLGVAIDDLLIFVGCAAIDGPGGTLATSNSSAAINSVTDATLREQLRARYDGADFQPWTGWISFDCGEDWFVDPTPATNTDLPPNRPDLISTASHELGHILGFGTAGAHFALVENATFTGAHAVTAYGSAVPLISNGTHFVSGLSSNGREPLLDPSRPGGTRWTATPLDVAALQDLGYDAR